MGYEDLEEDSEDTYQEEEEEEEEDPEEVMCRYSCLRNQTIGRDKGPVRS